ncbi:FCD domain-containing protein [Desulfosporosinus sp. OT]|uniref:FCD domain-containing protein n=1 Tax=Desulfosporosinus sp. OT TaxID=913865 RepID=UPI001FA7C46F|nr:FCD domain-containing protein [Desulfosporosinus sp. OT]
MPRKNDNYVYEILTVLAEKAEPLGSGQLSQSMHLKGFNVSEATVGRILSQLDKKNMTEKLGFQGRIITNWGREELVRMQNLQELRRFGNQFIEILESLKEKDLLDILTARKAIERELARLAALYSTEAEIKLLETVLLEQQELSVRKQLTAEHDVKFHKTIASAGKNKVLAAALDLIRHDAKLSPILEYIRTQVGGELVVGHSEIVKAIKLRDPDQAERAMIQHIESLILDVKRYWSIAKI